MLWYNKATNNTEEDNFTVSVTPVLSTGMLIGKLLDIVLHYFEKTFISFIVEINVFTTKYD